MLWLGAAQPQHIAHIFLAPPFFRAANLMMLVAGDLWGS